MSRRWNKADLSRDRVTVRFAPDEVELIRRAVRNGKVSVFVRAAAVRRAHELLDVRQTPASVGQTPAPESPTVRQRSHRQTSRPKR